MSSYISISPYKNHLAGSVQQLSTVVDSHAEFSRVRLGAIYRICCYLRIRLKDNIVQTFILYPAHGFL
ncbi:hypothetical protein LINPERHAP1_LOCUS1291, partial [Linum perenne]